MISRKYYTRKIQLTIATNFMTFKEDDEESVIFSNSDEIEMMINDKEVKVIKEFFQSLLSRYQIGLETSIKGSDFIFDCVYLLYYKCHKINFKCGESYIDFPDWTKTQH